MRHTSTNKHQNNINKPPVEGVATTKELADTLEMLCEEIDNLKKDNAEIRRALQECKQLIMDMKTHLAYT
jgi:prefoldin subunit 5